MAEHLPGGQKALGSMSNAKGKGRFYQDAYCSGMVGWLSG